MSLITPTVFGDFQSPVVVSQAAQFSGVMPEGAGLDPAVSTMLNNIVQQDILPTAGALTVAEFGIGSNSDAASGSYAAASPAKGSDVMDNVPTMIGDMSGPMIARGAVDPICSEDEVAGKLEIGGEFWTTREPVSGERNSRPRSFRAVCLSDQSCSQVHCTASARTASGPIWSRQALRAACAAPAEVNSTTSPIENDLLWIALSIVLGALVVMWMSRGARLPTI